MALTTIVAVIAAAAIPRQRQRRPPPQRPRPIQVEEGLHERELVLGAHRLILDRLVKPTEVQGQEVETSPVHERIRNAPNPSPQR